MNSRYLKAKNLVEKRIALSDERWVFINNPCTVTSSSGNLSLENYR